MMSRLSSAQTHCRLRAIAAIALCAALLRSFDPVNAHGWLPLSCGAITGVPCIFCGTTRALHCLLNGELSRAFYFNWIAFPLAGLAGAVVLVSMCELAWRKQIVRVGTVRVRARAIAVSLVALIGLWMFQVWLAVSQHKSELLNPRGPLYSLLVR